MFYQAEHPRLDIKLLNNSLDGACRLEWTFTDFFGQASKGGKSVALPATVREVHEPLPLDVPVPGLVPAPSWFCANAQGDKEAELAFSFVILPPDTRQAGYESPYGTWWFGDGRHAGTDDIRTVGPLFLMAGLRRSTLAAMIDDHQLENPLSPYKMTTAAITYRFRSYAEANDAWQANMGADIDRETRNYPNCKLAMVFHEEGMEGLQFPAELYGGTPAKLTAEQESTLQAHPVGPGAVDGALLPREASGHQDHVRQFRLVLCRCSPSVSGKITPNNTSTTLGWKC